MRGISEGMQLMQECVKECHNRMSCCGKYQKPMQWLKKNKQRGLNPNIKGLISSTNGGTWLNNH